MAGLFNLPARSTRQGDSLLVKKGSKSTRANTGISIKGGGSLLEKISTINAMVNKYLGKYADRYAVIRDEKELIRYIDSAVQNGIIAIDTETNSLDPITCTLAGVCLYTPNEKGVYVPLHHVSYVTGIEIADQLSDEFVAEQLQRLVENNVKNIMFNAKFDIRVIRNQLNVFLKCHWDGYLAARCLNENEPENNLKTLHKKYCMQGKEDAFTFDSLFKGIPFTHIPINTGYLYAARDPEITFELYEFQKPYLTEDDPVCIERDLTGPAYIFNHIEMPLIDIVATMEDTGVAFDLDLASELSVKYNEKLAAVEEQFQEMLKVYKDDIDNYRLSKGANNKLADPVSISSPTQLAILLYDILNIEPPNKEKPRGTGEDILTKINHPITDIILKYRELSKLVSTYIDKLPNNVNPKTGRVHASFNQIGADTGRFSSSDPNLQNIPSHNKDIRQMFTASPGCVLLSSDYSAQEPRITAHLSGDEKMIDAYNSGLDLYARMASLAFNMPYEECLEFRPDGTKNPEGKERRGKAKAIFLGICYGKGVRSIGEDLGLSTQKAQQVYDSVLKEFPGLKQFMEDSQEMARTKGFVTTVWGRKRRLPDMQLPPYEFSYVNGVSQDFDPLFDSEMEAETTVDSATVHKYTTLLNKAYGRQKKEEIKRRAQAEGIIIKDNGGFIAEATRQCVNSRIQGSASDQTKIAMLLVGNDTKLKELGFKLLLPVHDELIGECPEENVKEVAERFSALMVEAAKDLCVPSKCDVEVSKRWYGETLEI